MLSRTAEVLDWDPPVSELLAQCPGLQFDPEIAQKVCEELHEYPGGRDQVAELELAPDATIEDFLKTIFAGSRRYEFLEFYIVEFKEVNKIKHRRSRRIKRRSGRNRHRS